MNDLHINRCAVHWLGCVEYAAAWDLQDRIARQVADGERLPTLLLLEHPHTYTLGKRGKADHLLLDEESLRRRGVAVHWVDRGGDITYHGPGQLVGYPILPLAKPGWQGERLPQADFLGYLRKLEQTLVMTLAIYGIPAGQREGLTGVWVPADVRARCLRCDPDEIPQPGKIASIGVKIDARGVSRHGFALNVRPDMSYWDGIVPCGLHGVAMIAMQDLLAEVPDTFDVAQVYSQMFGEVFACEMVWEREEALI